MGTVHYNPIISIANAVITCDSATYNGQTQVATNIVVTLNGETLISGTDYTVSNNDGGINAGNYTFTVNGIGNYGGSKNGTFTINKVTPTVTVPTAISSIVYNADAQSLVNAGSADYGTLQYSLDDSNYSTTIPSGTNAGSYTIYYKVVGNSNVNDVASASINNSISKATPTVVIPVAKVLTYQKGVAQELVTAGSTDFGIMKYSTDGETYSTSVPSKTRAGSYTVYYFVEGDSNVNSTEVATVACSINEKPVTATIELSQDTYTYDGSAKEPTVTVKDGGDVIDPSEYTVTYSNNTNAGTASVTITDNTAGDYNVSGVTTFTINKAAGSVTTQPTAKSLTYNNTDQTLVTAGSGTGTMMYKLGSGSWGTSIPTSKNASDYTVYYKASASTNYEESASGSVAVNIAKVTPTVTAPTAKSLTYNGSAQALVNAGSTNYGTLKYSTDGSTYSAGIPSGTNATSYTVYYKVDGDSNINSVAAQSVAVTIAKADQTAPTATGATTTYPTTATATANGGGGQGSIEWESAQSQSSVGSHTTRARWAGNSNYNASPWSSSVTVQMNKANPSYTAPTAKSGLVYDGSAQTLLNAGSTSDGDIQYSSDNSSWSSTIPTKKNADSYTVYWKLVGDNNHNDVVPTNISVTIEKKTGCTLDVKDNAGAKSGSTSRSTPKILYATNTGDAKVNWRSYISSIADVSASSSPTGSWATVAGRSTGTTYIIASVSDTSNCTYSKSSDAYTITIT